MQAPSIPRQPQVSRPMIAASELEGEREQQRRLQQRRAGYASTVMTRGGLGILNLAKKTGLGV